MPWDGGTDFIANTKAFASLFNDRFADIADYTDGIPVDDLENGSSGELVVCNSGGVPQYVSVVGEAQIAPGGAVTLKPKVRYLQQSGGGYTLNVGAIPGLTTSALESGLWFIFGKIEIETTSGGGVFGAQFQLEGAGTQIGIFKISTESSSPGTPHSGIGYTIGQTLSNGSHTARMTLSAAPSGLLNGVAVRGVLVAMKVA